MDEHKIKELLNTERELLPEEQALLEEWYDRFPQHDELTFASAADKERIGTEMKAAIDKHIHTPVQKKHKKTILFSLSRSIAAAILLVLSATAIWLYTGHRSNNQNSRQVAYIEVTAPQDTRNQLVVLPDSSKVWLMAGSTIKYPAHFETGQRDIELTNGMALFNVTHNDRSPFTVTTAAGVKTTVLGTSFNISSFKASGQVTVSVVTGKVKVADKRRDLGVLLPDQQIVYAKETGTGKMQAVNAHAAADWINGQIVLQDAGVDDVAQILHALYKVQVTYEQKDLAALRLNFRFTDQAALTEVLDLMKDISDIKYQIQGTSVILSR